MKMTFQASASFACLICLLCGGCSSTRPPRYFAATATMISVPQKTPADDIQKASPAAVELLFKADGLVGFAPPPICRGTSSLPPGLDKEVEAHCQTLLSGLEKSASKRGFRVLDWNRLKEDPYRAAAERNVDILFVIEELAIRSDSADRVEISAVSFSEQKSATHRVPYRLDNAAAVGVRCKSVFANRKSTTSGTTDRVTGLTMAVKMVSVRDGMSQWFYRHSENTESNPEAKKMETDLYYLSRGTKERGVGKIVVGTIFAGIGIASAVVGSRLYEDGTSLTLRNVGVGLSWFTVIPFAIALPIGAVGIYKEAKPAVYDAPETVICRDEPLTENPFTSDRVSESGTSVSLEPTALSTTESGPASPNTPQDVPNTSGLSETMAAHFFAELDMMIRAGAPQPADPPTAPAPSEKANPQAEGPTDELPSAPAVSTEHATENTLSSGPPPMVSRSDKQTQGGAP